MPLSPDQVVQLFTAGTVTIPPHFPDVGLISVDPKGIKLRKAAEPLVSVEHRVSPLRTDRYLLRLQDVSAILLVKDRKVDAKRSDWILGPDVMSEFAKGLDEEPGIVFVKEDVCVITQLGRAGTAGDLIGQGRPCEPCRDKEW